MSSAKQTAKKATTKLVGVRALVFAALLAATWGAAGWLLGRLGVTAGALAAAAARVDAAHAAAILAGASFFFVNDYVRIYMFLRTLGMRLRPAAGLRVMCISYFFADLTPNSELHLPMQTYLLSREGVPAATATALSLVKGTEMTLLVCVAGILALALQPAMQLPPAAAAGLTLSISFVVLFAAVLSLIVFAPTVVRGRLRPWAASPRARPWRGKVEAGVERFVAAAATLGRWRQPWRMASTGISVAAILAYAAVGALFADALAPTLPVGRTLAAFTVGLVVSYLAPVPGGVGVTELTTAYLLDPTMGSGAVMASILTRMVCWYAVVALGGVLAVDLLIRRRKE